MKNKRKRVTALTVILAIIMILLLSIVYQFRYHPEKSALHRLTFGDRTISGDVIPLDNSSSYITATYLDTVAVTSGGEMMFVGKNGKLFGEHPLLSMSRPALSVAGKYLIVGDRDGNRAVVFENKKKTQVIQCENTIDLVRINQNGYFLIVSQEKGYKALVTVYHPNGEELYRWHSGDRNVLDADVDYDGRSFKVAVLDTDQGVAAGKILFFDMNTSTPVNEVSSDTNLFCKIKCNRDHSLTALGDHGMTKFSPNATEMWTVDFHNRPLLAADISSVDRLMIVLASEENSGLHASESDIYVYNRSGKEKNELAISGQVESFGVYDDTAVMLVNQKIVVADIYGSGGVFLTPEKDLRTIELFDSENRILAIFSGGYEILKIR